MPSPGATTVQSGRTAALVLYVLESGRETEVKIVQLGQRQSGRQPQRSGKRGARRFGALRDRILVDDGFFDPLPESELARWSQ